MIAKFKRAQSATKHTKIGFQNAKGPYMISERHRHRYEVNNDYRDILKEKGLVIAGINPKKNLVEIIEIKRPSVFCCHPVSSRI